MACELEQSILDAAAANYDAVMILKAANTAEGQQIAMQEMAALGQVMMAYWLVQNCLANSGGGLMAYSPEESKSLLTSVPSISELLEFQKNVLPGLLKSR